MAEQVRRPRIAAISDFLPSPEQPYRGLPLYNTIQALRSYADVDAYCVDAVYPALSLLQPRSFQYAPPCASKEARPDIHCARFPALPLFSRPWNGVSYARRLMPLLAQAPPDLVIGYFAYPSGDAAVRLGHRLGIPALVGVLGSDVRLVRGVTKHAVGRALRRAAFVLAVSRDLCRHAIRLGAHPDRITAIPNGCDSDIFRLADRATARRELGVRPESELVVFVGRLVPLKGLRELFEITGRLIATRPRIELACIGDGPLREELGSRAGRELSGRVRMLGSQPPEVVARWLSAANLLCLPSYSEGCPNVVVEALSAGRPVVASDVGGIPDLLDADSGVLVRPRDPQVLGSAIDAVLQRSWDEPAIAAKSRRSWDDVARETFAVCQRVLSLSKVAGRESMLKLSGEPLAGNRIR